jgi:hypothetical protein
MRDQNLAPPFHTKRLRNLKWFLSPACLQISTLETVRTLDLGYFSSTQQIAEPLISIDAEAAKPSGTLVRPYAYQHLAGPQHLQIKVL